MFKPRISHIDFSDTVRYQNLPVEITIHAKYCLYVDVNTIRYWLPFFQDVHTIILPPNNAIKMKLGGLLVNKAINFTTSTSSHNSIFKIPKLPQAYIADATLFRHINHTSQAMHIALPSINIKPLNFKLTYNGRKAF